MFICEHFFQQFTLAKISFRTKSFMTGFSIHQSTFHKLTTTLPLTKEVVPNASKITHVYSFLIIWGFAVYSWFCASFLLLFKGVKMHSKDMPQLVYNSGRLEYRGFFYQNQSHHDSSEITRQGRQTDNFYCLESLRTFCLLKQFMISRKNNYMLWCKEKKNTWEEITALMRLSFFEYYKLHSL